MNQLPPELPNWTEAELDTWCAAIILLDLMIDAGTLNMESVSTPKTYAWITSRYGNDFKLGDIPIISPTDLMAVMTGYVEEQKGCTFDEAYDLVMAGAHNIIETSRQNFRVTTPL